MRLAKSADELCHSELWSVPLKTLNKVHPTSVLQSRKETEQLRGFHHPCGTLSSEWAVFISLERWGLCTTKRRFNWDVCGWHHNLRPPILLRRETHKQEGRKNKKQLDGRRPDKPVNQRHLSKWPQQTHRTTGSSCCVSELAADKLCLPGKEWTHLLQ